MAAFIHLLLLSASVYLSLIGKTTADTCGTESWPLGLHVTAIELPVLHCAVPDCLTGEIICSSLEHKSCRFEKEWVGVVGFDDITGAMKVRCCTFNDEAKRQALQRVGMAVLEAGDVFIGGGANEDNRLVGFDIISNIEQHRKTDGRFYYNATISRALCFDRPLETTNRVQPAVQERIQLIHTPKKALTANEPRAFQAPIVHGRVVPGESVSVADARTQLVATYFYQPAASRQNGDPRYAYAPAQAVDRTADIEANPSFGQAAQAAAQPVYGLAYVPVQEASHGSICFPGESLVQTPTGQKPMHQLQVGDLVATITVGELVVYTPIELFLHREPFQDYEFIEIVTERGSRIKLSAKHLIYVYRCEEVPHHSNRRLEYAQDVKTDDDCVLSTDFDALSLSSHVDRVTAIRRVNATGIYAPATHEGDLIVFGVLTSCFAHLSPRLVSWAIAKPFLYTLHRLHEWLSCIGLQVFATDGLKVNVPIGWYTMTNWAKLFLTPNK